MYERTLHFHQKWYFSYRLHGMILWLMHIHQLNTSYKTYWLKFRFGVIWGHRDQKVIFTKNAVFSYRLHGMVLWLTHAYSAAKYLLLKFRFGVISGHRDQKVIFTKNAISPTDYMVWSYDCLMHIHQLNTSYSNLDLRSFEVTGIKRSFSPKMLFLLQITWYGLVTDSCIFIS